MRAIAPHHIELQGHAIKNQDLLVASGTLSLCGSEGLSAVDDDVAAAVSFSFASASLRFWDCPSSRTLDCSLTSEVDLNYNPNPNSILFAQFKPFVCEHLLIHISQTHTRSQSLSLTHAAPTLDIQLRNRELTEIANSIATLAELFKDLSALVIDQGTLLDSIEYNIEQTAAHVGDAVKELDVASK